MKIRQGRLLLIVCRVLSCIQLFVTPWTVTCQATLSMEFSRQVYSSGLPFPAPGDLPDPGIEPGSPMSPALQADSLPAEPLGKPLSIGFSRQEYWSGLPCPPPGDLPDPRIEPSSLMSPALAGEFSTTSLFIGSQLLCQAWCLAFICSCFSLWTCDANSCTCSLHELQEGWVACFVSYISWLKDEGLSWWLRQ